MIDLHPLRALGGAALALRDDLAPADDPAGRRQRTLERQVDRLGALWPLACVVLAGTALLVGGIAMKVATPHDVTLVMIHGAIGTTLACLLLAALRLPVAKRWTVYAHIRIALLCGAGIAAGEFLLLGLTAHFAGEAYRLASFAAVFGAIVLTVVALYPVRAAILGFGAALVAVTGVQDGPRIGLLVALLCLLCLAVATYRLSRFDRQRDEARALAEAKGTMSARLVEEFESHSNGWFWQTDAQGRVAYLSAKVARELDLPNAPAIGAALTGLFRVDSDSPETERTLAFHLSSRTAFSNYSVRPAGTPGLERWWSMSGRPINDELGRFQGFIGSGSDLSERRRADAEIARLALFDGLTGLANRQRMRLSLDQALSPQASGHHTTALFLLDLDRFKAVNDTLGHQVGDILLKQVAQRLLRSIGDAGLVGRLGGDEFKVILPDEANRERLAQLADDVIHSLSQPYFVEGSSITIGCSIGVAIAPEHGSDAETLVRNSDLALYAAKADGRGIHRFFREELLEGARTRKQLEDDLRHALAQDQLHVVYQPVVSTLSEHIVGYEALVRWEHPKRGPVSPSEFIPVAEDCGLIEAIGEWVLRTACLEAASWPVTARVAVNVSPIQFANPQLPSIVTNALARSGLAPERLELEITEGVFLNDDSASDAMFRMLKGLGVRLALDDFGTGYSSLGYLKKAPFDKIKIDQSFVKGAAIAGNRNAAIIKAIVTLADTLGMETTAEGVEIQDEIALIRELGCSHIQGYVYGRPARAAAVVEQLAAKAGLATADGYRVSRAPRTTMLRTARIAAGGAEGEVRIRNMSMTGAMIDGIDIDGSAGDLDVMIELLENQMFSAKVRWAADGRAGLQFAETFDLSRLNPVPAPAPAAPLRKAG